MRKTRSIAITVLLFLLSCNAFKPYHEIVYDTANQRIFLKVPKGFEFQKFDFETVKSYGYKYKDSSILYITDESNGGINYYNITAADKWDSLQFMAFEKWRRCKRAPLAV